MIENLPGEIWKDIPNTGGKYKLSNKGRGMSLYNKTPKLLHKKNYIEYRDINKNKITVYIPTLFREMFSLEEYEQYIKATFSLNVFVKDLPGEIWKDIPNYEGFLISNKCRIKTTLNTCKTRKDMTERLLKYRKIRNNYVVHLKHKDFNVFNLAYSIFNNYNFKSKEIAVLKDKSKPIDVSNLHIIKSVNKFPYSIGDTFKGNIIKDISIVYYKGASHNYYFTMNCLRCNKDFKIRYDIKKYNKNNFQYCKNCIESLQIETKYNITILNKQGKNIICICPNCSKEFKTTVNQLYWLKTPNCGCLKYQNYYSRRQTTRHIFEYKGEILNSKHILYKKWIGIKNRTSILPSSKKQDLQNYVYKKDSYSGNGIKMCKFWKNNFIEFAIWSLDNGYKKGLTIDRIDNNGDYAPYNCQYITLSENTIKNNLHERNLSSAEYKLRKLIYEKRKRNWLKEMKAKGYKEEELI